jgi:uncharacterized protein
VTDLVVIAVAMVIAAGIQVTMGFGFALVAIPIVAVVEDPKVAVVLITAVGVPMTLWNTYRWRRDLRLREMLTVAGASLVGMPLGALALTRAPDRAHAHDRDRGPDPHRLVVAWPPAPARAADRGLGRRRVGGARHQHGDERAAARDRVPGDRHGTARVPCDPRRMLPRPGRRRAHDLRGERPRHRRGRPGAFVVGMPAVVAGTLVGERWSARLHGRAFRAAVLVLLACSGALAVGGALTA